MKVKINRAIVGMDLGESDKPMLKFLGYLAAKIPIETASFIHVVPSLELYSGEKMEDFILLSKEIAAKMGKKLKGISISQSPQSDEYIVTEGNPLDELITTVEKSKADLIVVGKSSGMKNHGILLKNLVRRTNCNALVIPDKSKPKINHILVPFDFSQNSIISLKTALSLRSAIGAKTKLTVLNIYELPSLQTYRIGKTQEQLEKFLMEDRQAAFENFLQTYFSKSEKNDLDIKIVKLENGSIADAIMNYAKKNKVDLIVQGAKGHSKVGLLLLGSVSESVLNQTDRIPVFVVKQELYN